jgi:hypothetical protein
MYNNKIYYVNKGSLQGFSQINNNKRFNEFDWDSDYNGNIANIAINCNNNGKKQNYGIRLNNNDLANLLNIPSVDIPIHKRIEMDFNRPQMVIPEPKIYQLVLPESTESSEETQTPIQSESIENVLENMNEPESYLPSPMSNEELIVPISIDDDVKKYTMTPHRRHKYKKTHKTYRVYKKPKSKTPKSSRTSSSKSKSYKSSRNRTKRSVDYSIF